MRRASTDIWNLLEPVTRSMGYDFVGAEFGQSDNGMTLRIYIDAEDGSSGIQIEDCAEVSRQLGALLDVEDPIGGEYCLEVSSPGVERPLFTEEQFRQQIGQSVKIKLRQSLMTDSGDRKNFKGELTRVESNVLEVEVDGTGFELALKDIEQARLIFQFG